MSGAHHTFQDHTGDVKLRVEARTLPGLFAEAGRALGELMMDEGATTGTLDAGEVVLVRAVDRCALLAAWINELLFHSEVKKRVFTEFHIELLTDQELRATIRGIEPPHLRTAIKAATLHGLAIERLPGGYAATVVLDV